MTRSAGSAAAYSARVMATDKRARQRANRAEKQAIEAKAARRAKAMRLARRIVVWGLIILALLVAANFFLGGGGGEDALGSELIAAALR